jgi:hypothetical protein
MLYSDYLERLFSVQATGTGAIAPRNNRPRRGLSDFQLAIAAMVGIAALLVVIAAGRLTDQAVYRSVEERQAPNRFLVEQLGALRLMAMTSTNIVPARLYLGIEECFRMRMPMPFDEAAAGSGLAACADMEIGRLQAQGGARMAEEGARVLRDASLSTLSLTGPARR